MMTIYQGVLHFFSETGTEGGSWAFQDEKFMNLPAPNQYRCTRCGRVWDKDRDTEPPKPFFTYWRVRDGHGSYYAADHFDPDGDLGPDQRYAHACNETSRQCAEDGHQGWESMYPNGMWSYEGLHELRDGDLLTVWGDDGLALWNGVITLPLRQDPYAEGAYAAAGWLAAHRKPPADTNEDWWFEERRATLTTKDR